MTTERWDTRFLVNPGPVDDIRQDNAHRVGAPNHHHSSGSGENLMVSTTPQPNSLASEQEEVPGGPNVLAGDTSHWTPLMPYVEAVRVERDALGRRVVELRAENAALREQLAAEQDAANDAVVELIGQLEEAGVPVTSITAPTGMQAKNAAKGRA